jgi:CBS-domain-containing membrane protein
VQWVSPDIDLPLLVGSFGASAVLLFAVVESKLSQPRNFMGGQVLSSVVGVVVRLVIPVAWIAQPVSVSLAILAMMLTSTTHPPGGATALIVAGAVTLPKWSGFSYCVTVLAGSAVMQASLAARALRCRVSPF